MLETILAYGGDIALLRVAVLFFVFVLVYIALMRSSMVAGKKVAVALAALIALIAVLGFSDEVVVAIMTGYSGIGTAILFLLPLIVLGVVLFWKSDSLGMSALKLVCAVLVLVFIELLSSSLRALGTTYASTGGFDIHAIIAFITFIVYIVIFYFGFDVLSKLFFPAEREERS